MIVSARLCDRFYNAAIMSGFLHSHALLISAASFLSTILGFVVVVVVVDFRALPFFRSVFSSDSPPRSLVFSGELELDTSLLRAARTVLTCLAVAIASCAVVIYTLLGYVITLFSTMPRVTCTVLVIVYYTFWP